MDVYNTLGMTHFEVMEAMGINLNTTLTMIQFWTTATFGILAAFHFAGQRLTRRLVVLASALYATTSLMSLLAYMQSGISMMGWADAGEVYSIAKGVMSQANFQLNAAVRGISIYGGGLLIVLGTVATIYYGAHVRKEIAAADSSEGDAPAEA